MQEVLGPELGRSPGEGIGYSLHYSWASLLAQLVKNPSAMQETWIRSLGWEDPLEKGKGYPLQYSGLENSMDCISPWGHKKSDMTEWLSLSLLYQLGHQGSPRILEGIPSLGYLPQPRNRTKVSSIVGVFFTMLNFQGSQWKNNPFEIRSQCSALLNNSLPSKEVVLPESNQCRF